MKLAVYSVSLPEYNIEESVALVKEMGYDGIEWRVERAGSMRHFFPEKIDEYALRYWLDNKSTLDVNNIMDEALKAKKLCDEAGIKIVNFATSLGADYETLEKVLAAAQAVGCKSIRAFMTRYDKNKPFNDQFNEQREMLARLEPLLKKYGIKVLIETHHGMLVASASAGLRLLQGFDPKYYGLIFDEGNMVFEGYEDYRKSFELLGDYLAHVHIKNGCLEADGEDEFGAVQWRQSWTPLKKGMANLKVLIESLAQVGYDGYLSVEDFSNESPTREKLEDNVAYLRTLIDHATAAK